VKWPAMDSKELEVFEENLDIITRTSLIGNVERMIETMTRLGYIYIKIIRKERFGETQANIREPRERDNLICVIIICFY